MHNVTRLSRLVTICAFVVITGDLATAQPPLPTPQVSPKASISQTIGITDVTITYHRPGVKGRVIWGGLVPYGKIWRVGANENTTISFNDPVKVEGNDLAAGTYGVHMIPTEAQWTIIFSKNFTSWGSFFYKESEDALRITVTPQPAEFQEWMGFQFDELTNSSAVASLRWEKLKVPFRIDVDTKGVVLAHARDAYLRGPGSFSWQGYNTVASYCLRNNTDLDEALTWADQSISMNENPTNLATKAGLLGKLGKTAEADAVRERALKVAVTENDVNTVAYMYLTANKTKEAIDLFKKNVKAHPESWRVYDGLAQAYEKNADTRNAVENYRKALSMVKDDEEQTTRLTEKLKSLEKK